MPAPSYVSYARCTVPRLTFAPLPVRARFQSYVPFARALPIVVVARHTPRSSRALSPAQNSARGATASHSRRMVSSPPSVGASAAPNAEATSPPRNRRRRRCPPRATRPPPPPRDTVPGAPRGSIRAPPAPSRTPPWRPIVRAMPRPRSRRVVCARRGARTSAFATRGTSRQSPPRRPPRRPPPWAARRPRRRFRRRLERRRSSCVVSSGGRAWRRPRWTRARAWRRRCPPPLPRREGEAPSS